MGNDERRIITKVRQYFLDIFLLVILVVFRHAVLIWKHRILVLIFFCLLHGVDVLAFPTGKHFLFLFFALIFFADATHCFQSLKGWIFHDEIRIRSLFA